MAPAAADLPTKSEVTLRRPGTLAFGLLATAGLVVLLGWILFNPGVDHSLAGRALRASVMLAMTWFVWRVSGYPALRITPTHLVVRNPVFYHVVPWRAVESIEDRDNLTVVMWDRRELRVWAFSHSLIAEALGDRQLHRAIRLILQARRGAPAGPETVTHLPRSTVHLRWWVLPLAVLLTSGVVLVSWLLDPAATLT